jgi:hypothetical protein
LQGGQECPRYVPGLRRLQGGQECPRYAYMSMTRQQVLDLQFLDARGKLIELAAFLDRVDRASGEADFRLEALKRAIEELSLASPQRARNVLLALSDPTTDPIPSAHTKAASGAWPKAK